LLIITHQKPTMEIADALYGVSMRGDGITTVISQRLGAQSEPLEEPRGAEGRDEPTEPGSELSSKLEATVSTGDGGDMPELAVPEQAESAFPDRTEAD